MIRRQERIVIGQQGDDTNSAYDVWFSYNRVPQIFGLANRQSTEIIPTSRTIPIMVQWNILEYGSTLKNKNKIGICCKTRAPEIAVTSILICTGNGRMVLPKSKSLPDQYAGLSLQNTPKCFSKFQQSKTSRMNTFHTNETNHPSNWISSMNPRVCTSDTQRDLHDNSPH